jgi:endonuclease VIII
VPEGDTVWNTARALQSALAGQVLAGSDLRVPRLATTDLTGWRVLESTCRGKHLLLRLAQDDAGGDRRMTLHSHLRMDGAWRVYQPGQPWRGAAAQTIRAFLRTEPAIAVGFHLHNLALVRTTDEQTLVGHLGPDLLGPDWDPDEAARRLAAQPDTAIAEALLDQRNLAGIGNLYKCEVLFLRGVSPWTPVAEVPDLRGMAVLAQRMLAANAGRWTQSTTGSLRRFETTYVYGRRAQPCRRCGTLIDKTEQAQRVTYWCPACQPAHLV